MRVCQLLPIILIGGGILISTSSIPSLATDSSPVDTCINTPKPSLNKSNLRLVLQTVQREAVTALVFSHDGKILITGGSDNLINIWNTHAGTLVKQLKGHSHAIESLALHPGGRVLSSGDAEGKIKLWDLVSGAEILSLDHGPHLSVVDLKWMLEGCVLVSASGASSYRGGGISPPNHIVTWDVKAGRRINTAIAPWRNGGVLSLHPTRSVAAISDTTGIVIWDYSSGKEILQRLNLGTSSVRSLLWSPDGNQIAVASSEDQVRVFYPSNPVSVQTLQSSGTVVSLAYSEDGKVLVGGLGYGQKTYAHVWNLDGETRSYDLTHSINADWIGKVAISVKSGLIATGGLAEGSSFALWNLGGGVPSSIPRRSHDKVGAISWHPQRKNLAVGGVSSVSIWSTAAGRQVDTLSFYNRKLSDHSNQELLVWDLAFSGNGKYLAAASSNGLEVWDIESSLQVPFPSPIADHSAVAFSPQNNILASVYGDSVVLWDLKDRKQLLTLEGHTAPVSGVAFSPDGKSLITSGGKGLTFNPSSPSAGLSELKDGSIIEWDLVDLVSPHQKRKLVLDPVGVKHFRLSPDGTKVAFIGEDDLPRLITLDLASDVKLLSAESPVRSLAWGLNGQTLALGHQNGKIAIVNVTDLKHPNLVVGDYGPPVVDIEYLDDRFIAALTSDGLFHFYSVPANSVLVSAAVMGDARWIVIDKEGRFDSNKLEETLGANWVLPDYPFTSVSFDVLMKDYYDPGLLRKSLNGETLRGLPVGAPKTLIQPSVEFGSFVRDLDDQNRISLELIIKVPVEGICEQANHEAPSVHDLKLFNDQIMVRSLEDVKLEPSLDKSEWVANLRIADILLPTSLFPRRIDLSAFVFGCNGLRSATAHKVVYAYPHSLLESDSGNPRRRAYIVSIGVNNYRNSAWNLNYPTSDALVLNSELSNAIQKERRFGKPFNIFLVDGTLSSSDREKTGPFIRPTKENIKAVITKLGDGTFSPLTDEDGIEVNLGPSDLVVITFSGHGFVSESGEYYLAPTDIGTPRPFSFGKEENFSEGISGRELVDWLKGIIAGELVLIVDACYSGAFFDKDFRAGPFDNHDLGQLAYDKKIRVLASSQPDEYSAESNTIGQGLLTKVLTQEGIRDFLGDHKPKDGVLGLGELLRYAETRTPNYAKTLRGGNSRSMAGGTIIVDSRIKELIEFGEHPIQTPVLFDFNIHDMTLEVRKPLLGESSARQLGQDEVSYERDRDLEGLLKRAASQGKAVGEFYVCETQDVGVEESLLEIVMALGRGEAGKELVGVVFNRSKEIAKIQFSPNFCHSDVRSRRQLMEDYISQNKVESSFFEKKFSK